MRRDEREKTEWKVKTTLGKKVDSGEFTDINSLFDNNVRIREPEIVDKLIPDLEEEVIGVGKAKRPYKKTQRMTDSGRRQKFFVMVAIGNRKGYSGLGIGKAWEYGPALKKALNTAKMNLIRVPLGCGSWECGCKGTHSTPLITTGRSGSVRIKIQPAPKGTGLAANDTSKIILSLAGIRDAWTHTKGRTRCRMNTAKATFNALQSLNNFKGRNP